MLCIFWHEITYHHHHHVVLLARISLTLSRHFSLSFITSGRSSGLHSVLSHCHLHHHNDTIIKTQEDFFINICTSHFIVRVRKGLLKFCVREGAGDRTETSIFWPLLLWPSALCLSCSPDAQPEAQRPTLLGDGFLYCILSASSPDLNSSGLQGPFGLMWLSLPYLVYNSVSNSNGHCPLTSVLTELYNSSTPTWSPTRSLKSHV